MIENIGFYTVNYKDEDRKNKMISRFDSFKLELIFVDTVEKNDERLANVPENADRRTWSIMLQHMDSIRHFVEKTSKHYCIVTEDDILISKEFVNDLPDIINTFNDLELDLILLGYLLSFKIYDTNNSFVLKARTEKYSYYDYPSDIWGAQMYLISRKHAINLLDRYTIEHAISTIDTMPFNPDWTLTKYGKKALISPMIAVEEGNVKNNLYNEIQFHLNCFNTNYVDGLHI